MCGKYYADREFIPHLSTLFKEQGILPDPELREEWERVLLEAEDDLKSGVGHDQNPDVQTNIAHSLGAGSVTDVSPTDRAVTISMSDEGLVALKMRWGFRDPYHDTLVINARAESATAKPMFAESVRECRCVIPASGYYEWDRSKSRYRFTRPDGGLVLLAGIYRLELVRDSSVALREAATQELTRNNSAASKDAAGQEQAQQFEPHFTVLTTEANECMKPVHPRMPVMIEPSEIRTWITDGSMTGELLERGQLELIREQDSGQMALNLGI